MVSESPRVDLNVGLLEQPKGYVDLIALGGDHQRRICPALSKMEQQVLSSSFNLRTSLVHVGAELGEQIVH